MVKKRGLKEAYSIKTTKDSINLYKIWASTYDDDFATKNDYRSPLEIANYYEKYSNVEDSPILDVGAGTGLIGECLNKNKGKNQIDGLDISSEMLNLAKLKKCYRNLIQADLTKKLIITDNYYGAILSAGTFTHGHVGPKVFDELLRIIKPNGLFIITIHTKIFQKGGFEKKLFQLHHKITKPVFHEVRAYGNNADPEHGKDTVFVTVFRKK